MDFDPNARPPKVRSDEWATYVPDRRGSKFKIHAQGRGAALNAFQYRDSAILYRKVNNIWVEIYRIEDWKRPDHCEECQTKIPYGHRTWVNKKADSPHLPRLKYLCYPCNRASV